jgi:hypothetical protein
MKLADQIAQFRAPFVVICDSTRQSTRLNNTADCAAEVAAAPIRFVLSDDLTRLCTALAYSKGARTLACADLVRVPAEAVWIEWSAEAWHGELQRYGFAVAPQSNGARGGRRGALIRASRDGRRGTLRTFWSGAAAGDVLASSIVAYFDLDTQEGDDPEPPAGEGPELPTGEGPDLAAGEDSSARRVVHEAGTDILGRCFRFRYERSWSRYYQQAALGRREREVLWRHALGTIAIDIPLLLAFFLLLATRSGLPQQRQSFERLNRSRLKCGKAPLLEHIDVRAPLLPEFRSPSTEGTQSGRRSPRLHHVRGHLVRRGSELFWRVPHLRGSARQGNVRSRTVTWTFERSYATNVPGILV